MKVFREFDQYGMLVEAEEVVDMFVAIDTNMANESPSANQNVFTRAQADDSRSVYESIMDQCRSLASAIRVHELVAFLLLSTQNWNIHRVYENWASDGERMLAAVGVEPFAAMDDPSLRHPPAELMPEEGWTCDICARDEPFTTEEMWCLPCGHTFCSDCWAEEVRSRVEEGAAKVGCMEMGCKCCLPPNSVKDLCGHDVYENLMRFLMDQQVFLADTLTNCPNARCGKPIDLLAQSLCSTAKCSHCLHEFCTECHEQSHAPATCSEKQKWETFTDPEIMKQRLFGPNVKTCPNCKCTIEKNEGCNHMTCRQCNHEFCWLCMGEWSKHPKTYYECAAYRKEDDPFLKKPDNVNRELLEGYNEVFMKRGVKGKSMKDKMNADIAVVSRAIVDPVMTREELEQVARELLDELYWANENLRWSQVHMFMVDFEYVKNLPVEQQLQSLRKVKVRPKHLLFKHSVAQLQKQYELIDDQIDGFRSQKKTATHVEVSQMVKKLRLFRQAMLKQCDTFYE